MNQTSTTPNLWTLALTGGAIGAVINTLIILLAPSIIGEAIQVPNPSTNALEPLPLFAVIAASIVPAFIGLGILLLLQRFTKNSMTIFLSIGVVFTLLSLIGPFTMPINFGVKIALNLMHLVAAASILVALSRAKIA
jgi:hypothetical protein